MSGIFCNHVLTSVCPSFEKHSSSSLGFASDPSSLQLPWYKSPPTSFEMEKKSWRWGGDCRESRRWRMERRREKKRKKLGVFTVCLTSLHSINIMHALKLAWRRVQGRPGVSSHQYIPLATSTHTRQSITPQAAHNDWSFWSWLKAVTPRLRRDSRVSPFFKQHLEQEWTSIWKWLVQKSFSFYDVWLFCNPKISGRSDCFVSRRQQGTSHLTLRVCFARLMSSSLCKQVFLFFPQTRALPTKFAWHNSELIRLLCNVCDFHQVCFLPHLFFPITLHRLRGCCLRCLWVCLEAVWCWNQMSVEPKGESVEFITYV